VQEDQKNLELEMWWSKAK